MKSIKVAVIDYGVGNLLSVERALLHSDAQVVITSDPKAILEADRVVLPGVGAFGEAMRSLENLDLIEVIKDVSCRQIPLLGICLGMQLLLEESEEFGIAKGLGIIPGQVVALPSTSAKGERLKKPQIGWNALIQSSTSKHWKGTLLEDCKIDDAVYFIHSYMALPAENIHRLADYNYGGHRVSAVISKDNTTGCQFHPEKSGQVGLSILKKFING